jgi:hypothetical protein
MTLFDEFLQLPPRPIPDRAEIVRSIPRETRQSVIQLDGPGCIRHIALVTKDTRRPGFTSRDMIMRIYFDDSETPQVEAPFGDFFGVMHGEGWYPLNTHWLSIMPWGGMNCYFPMPFARNARIEFEAGPVDGHIYLQVDWHRYPDQTLTTPHRFCARWRRECPTASYGEQYLLLDTVGTGLLAGFVYGVRLFDNEDRWSHGGAENIYIDGQDAHPAFIRGVGGEDTFGVGYGGNQTVPLTHHFAAMPYYIHEDIGEARPAPRLVGYRFYEQDSLPFQESLQFRFGCMVNDISSTVYWYQDAPVLPQFRMPAWNHLRHAERALPKPGFPRGTYDAPLPSDGDWWLCGPFAWHDGRAMSDVLPPEREFDSATAYDGGHGESSGWLTEGARRRGRDKARWVHRDAHHGFIDFNHVFQPVKRGVGVSESGVAYARCLLEAPADMMVTLRLTFDDALAIGINGGPLQMLGDHAAFRTKEIQAPLKQGANIILIKQGNTIGFNHGGWAFNFQAVAHDGSRLRPKAP